MSLYNLIIEAFTSKHRTIKVAHINGTPLNNLAVIMKNTDELCSRCHGAQYSKRQERSGGCLLGLLRGRRQMEQ